MIGAPSPFCLLTKKVDAGDAEPIITRTYLKRKVVSLEKEKQERK
jgi:hypothetical protein